MNLSLISKHRSAIYGFSIIWVVIFHAIAIDKIDFTFGHHSLIGLQKLIGMGNVGVDVFLFLSGVCLYFSFQKNQDIGVFIKKRLMRILPAAYLVYVLYWAIKYLIISFDPSSLLACLTLMRFWMTGDQTMWFVSVILVLYFAYPYIYYAIFGKDGKNERPWLRCLILMAASYLGIWLLLTQAPDTFKMCEIGLTRIPVFIFGCWFGRLVYEKVQLPKWCAAVPFALFALLYALQFSGIFSGYQTHMLYIIGGVSIGYVLALLLELIKPENRFNRAMAFVGGFSLEYYLTSIMTNQVLRMTPWYSNDNFMRCTEYLLLMLFALMLAYLVKRIVNRLLS